LLIDNQAVKMSKKKIRMVLPSAGTAEQARARLESQYTPAQIKRMTERMQNMLVPNRKPAKVKKIKNKAKRKK
jgi:hypothetical protein